MRANRRSLERQQDDAQVGIGTMIVFIATVLVAAIAAAVLIDTSSKLQERSSRTGNEATDQVSSNMKIERVVGVMNTAGGAALSKFWVYVSLAPGAQTVDLNEVKLQLQNGTALHTYDYDASAASTTDYIATELRDADDSWLAATPVMTSGDLIRLEIDLTQGAREQPVRKDVSIVLLPEIGSKVQVGFKTPPSYGQNTHHDLA